MLKELVEPAIRNLVTIFFRQKEQLDQERLLTAYRNGLFPLAGRFGRIHWYNPHKRAILPLDERFLIGKKVSKKIRSNDFDVTFDRDFRKVIEGCAELKPGRQTTWISSQIMEAYLKLHQSGYAHSIEVWREGRLVGGGYGVAINGFYSGESMFNREESASRVAMVYLVNRLRENGFSLLDTQFMSSFTREFGAFEIDQATYKSLLSEALKGDVKF